MVIANSNPQFMVPEPRVQYISPACEVLEINPEGIVCASGGPYPGWPGENI